MEGGARSAGHAGRCSWVKQDRISGRRGILSRLAMVVSAAGLCVGVATVGAGPASGARALLASHVATMPGSVLTPLTPTRICDTRPGNPSGLSGAAAQCNSHGPIGSAGNLAVATANWVPTGATAAVLNVTVITPSANGFVSVLPTAPTATPTVSSLDFSAGLNAVANAVIVPLSSAGFDVYNSAGTTDVAIDLTGWFASPTAQTEAGEEFPLSPFRIADTRCGTSPPPAFCSSYTTIPPANIKLATIPPGGSIDVQVSGTGSGSDSVPSFGVAAVTMNLTAVSPSAAGYLSVWATGAKPAAPTSVVNFAAGQTLPNRVVVPISPSGDLTVYNGSTGHTDALVDVDGWFADATSAAAGGSLFYPVSPTRICDTRPGNPSGLTGGAAQCNTNGPVSGGMSLPVQVGGNASVPTGVDVLVGNVTALDATQPTFATVTPVATSRPTVSDLNPVPKQVEANMVIGSLSSTTGIDVYDSVGSIDVLVDVFGYLCPKGSLLLAGYETTLDTAATAIEVIPRVSCASPTPATILVGVSLWDRGGNDIGAVVKITCTPTSAPPTYTAEGFFFSQPTGAVSISPLAVSIAPGDTVATTATAASPATATVKDLTTGTSASATYTAVGAGPAFVGMFCSTNWNVPTLCGAPPSSSSVAFSKVFLDASTALGKVSPPPTAQALVDPACAWSITPTAVDPTGTAFDEVYR